MDIRPDLWFFKCHFQNDPVMPGCLGVDAMWQMVGFFLGWLGGLGKGRALGVGEVKFSGMVLPNAKLVSYYIEFKRVIMRKLVVGVADGIMKVDGKLDLRSEGSQGRPVRRQKAARRTGCGSAGLTCLSPRLRRDEACRPVIAALQHGGRCALTRRSCKRRRPLASEGN